MHLSYFSTMFLVYVFFTLSFFVYYIPRWEHQQTRLASAQHRAGSATLDSELELGPSSGLGLVSSRIGSGLTAQGSSWLKASDSGSAHHVPALGSRPSLSQFGLGSTLNLARDSDSGLRSAWLEDLIGTAQASDLLELGSRLGARLGSTRPVGLGSVRTRLEARLGSYLFETRIDISARGSYRCLPRGSARRLSSGSGTSFKMVDLSIAIAKEKPLRTKFIYGTLVLLW